MKADKRWASVCALDDILPQSGVCASLEGRQIAVFRVGNEVFAIDNFDPASGANVLSRGVVGDVSGELVVASPVYKHHYGLRTGRCLEAPEHRVATYPVRVVDGEVFARAEAESVRARGIHKRRLVVVGNGMAGIRTVEELLAIAPDAEVVVIGAEPHGSYNRTLLSPLLSGERRVDDIMTHERQWYSDHGVTLYAGDPVVRIDRWRKVVVSKAGLVVPYQRLLLATGSSPVALSLPGSDLPGVMTFRDLHDVNAMLAASRAYKRAVVVGGGLLGLEAASGLLRQGMDVSVVHRSDALMERHLDPAAASLLRTTLSGRGVNFRMPAYLTAIHGEGRVTGVELNDGETIETDLVVLAIGIRPNIELAQSAGLRCERGIVVDDTMQTFDPSIYAVGECAQHRNTTYGLVAPLWDQARVCATHLAEVGTGRFASPMVAAQLKVTGIELFSAGDFSGNARSESMVMHDPKRGVYKHLVIENDKLRGAVLYGDAKDGAWYLELMRKGDDIGPLRDRLLFGQSFAASERTTR